MPTHYLYGTVLTGQAVAANNRGDNVGNTTTLQKVFVNDDLHTSVSAEAIRFAIRYRFQLQGLGPNRTYDGATGKLKYEDEKRTYWGAAPSKRIDDDIMGFMDAAAAKQEREEEEAEAQEPADQTAEPKKKQRKPKAKGPVTKRPSPLALGRAVSLRPYRGEVSFNCVSGEKGAEKAGGGKALSLYAAEMHTTEYQYSFGLNLGDVIEKEHIEAVIDAIIDPPQVAGNHARFAYDFSPETIVLRVTSAHSSRIQNCFGHDEQTRGVTIRWLVERVRAGDLAPSELFVGGRHAGSEEGQELKRLGVSVDSSVDKTAAKAKEAIQALGYAIIAKAQ